MRKEELRERLKEMFNSTYFAVEDFKYFTPGKESIFLPYKF